MEDENSRPPENGFELDGVFYPWHLDINHAKNLFLIDRLTRMPPDEFARLAEDPAQRTRSSVILTLIATSIRAKHPDWTVERIERMIMDLDITTVEWIGGDVEEDPRPPDGAAKEAAKEEGSTLPPGGFSPSSTPEETLPTSETLSAIPA